MYKVMLIDDERPIRNLLKTTVKWKDLGLEVAGEAASGIEAINTIDEIRPDIVFVDIRMPFMDGIEFSRLAIMRYPKIKILVLTAYDDFEYARKCIGIGICDYLLKPIRREEINETLKGLVADLENRDVEDDVEEGRKAAENDTVAKVKKYLRTNYRDPNINLSSTAAEFGFNASYLSRLFKAESGINLSEYLIQCRMGHALKLAEKGMLMYMTAKEVGIPDPNYFGKCFKKQVGVSYSDYFRRGQC
jgi:YesN/AraC family two-component response regulator